MPFEPPGGVAAAICSHLRPSGLFDLTFSTMKDLKTLSLVNRTWYEATRPFIWDTFRICYTAGDPIVKTDRHLETIYTDPLRALSVRRLSIEFGRDSSRLAAGLLSLLPNVRRLSVSHDDSNEEIDCVQEITDFCIHLEHIPPFQFHSVRVLKIAMDDFPEYTMLLLMNRFPQVRELELVHHCVIEDTGALHHDRWPELHHLRTLRFRLIDACLPMLPLILSKAPSLSYLYLEVPERAFQRHRLSDREMSTIWTQTSLTHLFLTDMYNAAQLFGDGSPFPNVAVVGAHDVSNGFHYRWVLITADLMERVRDSSRPCLA